MQEKIGKIRFMIIKKLEMSEKCAEKCNATWEIYGFSSQKVI